MQRPGCPQGLPPPSLSGGMRTAARCCVNTHVYGPSKHAQMCAWLRPAPHPAAARQACTRMQVPTPQTPPGHEWLKPNAQICERGCMCWITVSN